MFKTMDDGTAGKLQQGVLLGARENLLQLS